MQLCTILGASGHGLDRDEILMCIDLIASTGGQSHSQSAVDGFFKRHGQLKLLGSSGIDPQRASQANEAVRDAYFCKLDAYINILYSMGRIKWKSFADVPNKFIYNMDELSSDTTKRRKKVAVAVDKSNKSKSDVRNYTITPEGDRMPFHITVCLTTRADGQYICPAHGVKEGAPPPVVIHSKSASTNPDAILDPYDVPEKLLHGLAPMRSDLKDGKDANERNNELGFLALATPNGSMKQCTMLPFAKHFVKNLPTERNPLEGIILLLDGHSSRWDLDALMYLFQNNVFPFFYPSHTSIWSQANDNGPNKRLHTCIENAAKLRRKGKYNSKFTPSDWNIIFREAYHRLRF